MWSLCERRYPWMHHAVPVRLGFIACILWRAVMQNSSKHQCFCPEFNVTVWSSGRDGPELTVLMWWMCVLFANKWLDMRKMLYCSVLLVLSEDRCGQSMDNKGIVIFWIVNGRKQHLVIKGMLRIDCVFQKKSKSTKRHQQRFKIGTVISSQKEFILNPNVTTQISTPQHPVVLQLWSRTAAWLCTCVCVSARVWGHVHACM